MQIYGSKFPISIALEFRDFFDMSKFLRSQHLKPQEIGDVFKNPNQGM